MALFLGLACNAAFAGSADDKNCGAVIIGIERGRQIRLEKEMRSGRPATASYRLIQSFLGNAKNLGEVDAELKTPVLEAIRDIDKNAEPNDDAAQLARDFMAFLRHAQGDRYAPKLTIGYLARSINLLAARFPGTPAAQAANQALMMLFHPAIGSMLQPLLREVFAAAIHRGAIGVMAAGLRSLDVSPSMRDFALQRLETVPWWSEALTEHELDLVDELVLSLQALSAQKGDPLASARAVALLKHHPAMHELYPIDVALMKLETYLPLEQTGGFSLASVDEFNQDRRNTLAVQEVFSNLAALDLPLGLGLSKRTQRLEKWLKAFESDSDLPETLRIHARRIQKKLGEE